LDCNLVRLAHLDQASSLPITQLTVRGKSLCWAELTPEVAALISSCKQLTCLKLCNLWLHVPQNRQPVPALVALLKQLPALSELSLVILNVDGPPSAWGQFWSAVPGMVSLRSLVASEPRVSGWWLPFGLSEGGAAHLAAATQLTHLELVGCGVSEAAEAQLRAGLTQLRRRELVVHEHARRTLR
jgi:hypothetical protein